MAVHARLKNKFTVDKKCRNLTMAHLRFNYSYNDAGSGLNSISYHQLKQSPKI